MSADGPSSSDLGIVVIGRNEGERLHRCLRSIDVLDAHVVYVDSGSSDGSVAFARGIGAQVVILDPAVPFTAARARNAGFHALAGRADRPSFVQFVDGDCEIVPGWLAFARADLASHPRWAVVCGRRRERDPSRSVYNRLADREWDTPIGEAKACGGDAMVRASAFEQVDGFRADLIAGEEPELCVRLRQNAWTIMRVDRDMTLHDAAMTRFAQWWARSKRAGFAFGEGVRLHGAPPERHWVRERRRALFWGLGLPASALMATAGFGPLGAALLLAYPLQFARLWLRETGTPRTRLEQASFLLLGKFAEATGIVRYEWRRRLRGPQRLIEYK